MKKSVTEIVAAKHERALAQAVLDAMATVQRTADLSAFRIAYEHRDVRHAVDALRINSLVEQLVNG